MPKKKKEEIEEEPEHEETAMMLVQEGPSPDAQLRLQLLGLSKEILEHRSHLSWETHKQAIEVTIEDVIAGARELFDFVIGEDEQE